MLGLRSEAVQVAPVCRSRGRGSATRGVRRFARSALLLTTLTFLASPAAAFIQGRVFEDVNYGGGAGRSFGASSGVGREGARVELYDNTGAFVEFQLTDVNGFYTFPQSAGTYTVRVVNSTVTSSRTLPVVVGLLPVQTYRRDASNGNVAVTDHVGGEVPSLVDAGPNTTGLTLAQLTTATTTAQSITTVTFVAPPNVSNVNFGFNFNTIVNVNDSGQGSLRQFLLNSNALGNATLAIVNQPPLRDVSVFMISDGNLHAGLHGTPNLLSLAGVAVISPVTALEAITDAATSVDGTTQTVNVGDTNAGVLGTGGTVGVGGLLLNTVAKPEVEISGSGMAANGLLIQAANAVVRGLAIHGFGTTTGEAGVRVDNFLNALVENNVLGSSATSFTDPGSTAQRNQAGVYSNGGSNSTVRYNLIGFGRVNGVYLSAGTAGWAITGNEIRDSGMDNPDGDGITINASPTNTSIGNLITGSSSQGIVVTVAGATGNEFTNNTVTGNGVGIPSGLVQSPGIVLRSGAASTVLDRNVISANYGAGVQANDGSTGTRMTRNSFALNGTIMARYLLAAATGQIGIDLNSPTDDINFGTPPFYTLNDAGDPDTGGNGLLNFPVLVWATLFGGNLSLQGYARPGSVIELFIASPDPTGFGEGTTYSITLTEGGTGAGGNDPYADSDAGTGTYGPGPVNGIAQGTDTTNRFTFFFPVPGGIGVGTPLTATATLGGETSEFSGNVTVAAATAVELMSFEAAPSDEAVELSWRTGSELDNLGFHLYRGPSAGGPWTRLTSSLIPGLGSSPLGQSYSWLDSGLVNGQRYYYRLEDVDTRSVSTFHGPVSAVPQASPAPPTGGGGGGEPGDGSGPGSARTSCPAWVLAAYGSPVSPSVTCTKHGDPESVSLDVLSHDASSATLELRTGGFWALHERSGTVRVFIPGLEFPVEARAAALPLRRALVDAVVGKKVRLASAEAFDLRGFRGLRPSAVGLAEMNVSWDGTVRPARRSLSAPSLSRGYLPEYVARLSGPVFQGERKSAVVEMFPVRFDGARQLLVLAGRVRVRLAFLGREDGESGTGSRGRALPRKRTLFREVLAQLQTSGRGLYAVSYEALFPLRPRGFSTALLRLQRQGEVVPFHVEPAGPVFGPGSVLYFFADRTASSTDYSGEVAYELVRSSGREMGLVPAHPVGAPAVPSSTGFASFETNRIYQAGLLDAPDIWLWEAMVSGVARTKPFTLSGVDTASAEVARLAVHLQGGSESGITSDHHVQLSVNGGFVGEATFAGKRPYRLDVLVPASLLREGANDLAVTNVGDTGVSSLVFLDRFEVSYPQASAARGGVFEGVWAEGGTAEVSGLSGPPVVVDVTDAVKWVTGYETAAGSVRFSAEAGRRYLIVSREGLLSPRIGQVALSTLREGTNQADYLVIGPGEFLAAAVPLLERRRSQGLVSRAVSFEEIASEFGRGQPSAEAIKAFLSYAYHSWQRPSPRYVLLLGDSTYDPRRFVASSWASPLPALWAKTSYLWTASDPALAAVNGEDVLPDLAIGRLPATTVEQAETLVGKLLAWEDSGQGLAGKAVLVADNPDVAGDFEADAEDIRASFLAGRSTTTLKLNELGAAMRLAILGAFDDGASLMSYVGHGGTAVWASENVLNSWDVPALRAQTEQPLLLTMNCLNGYFVAPNFDALSEAFLKAEGRGAIAAFSPSGLSVDGPAHQYHRAVMAELVSGTHERLGDAILAAQSAYAQTGLMPELLSVYQVLGDPAMRIQ